MRCASLIALGVVLAACSAPGQRANPAAKHVTPAVIEVYQDEPVDFTGRGARPAFREAVADFARRSHAQRVEVEGLPGAAGFRIDSESADRSIDAWNREYLERGVSVIRYDASFGYADEGDAILLLPTDDPWEVVRAASTGGVNYDIENADVIRWLKRLHRDHPFRIYGASPEVIEGRFEEAPSGDEAKAMAREMYRFDPDIVDQGTNTVDALAKELERTGTLYLWWD